MVSRLTFNARAIPRCDVRSASNPTMASSVTGRSVRLLAAGVNTFLHPLQRNFWLPQRFLPKRITNDELSQNGHAGHAASEVTTIHTVYGNNAGKSNARLGELSLRVPQVRGSAEAFYPQSLEHLQGLLCERGLRSERALKIALAEMYSFTLA